MTAKSQTTPITITTNILNTVKYENDVGKTHLAPGTIAYFSSRDNDRAGLMYVCPCGCQGVGALPFIKIDGKDAWNWNGSDLSPTLTPSILRSKTCGWHGFLTDGVFK